MAKNIGVCVTLRDKVSPTMKQIATRIGMTTMEFNKASKAVGKLSKELNNRMKAIAKATAVGFGAVVAGGVALAQKTAEAGDRIDKMSQKIGMSRKAFQEWDYIMSQNGGSVDTLQMGYKTLATQMDGVRKGSKDSIKAFNRLGVSVKNSNGTFRTQDEVFNDVVRKLQAMKNPTEKAIIAQKLFGKSAIELKPLLNQSASSIEDLRQKANDLGMVLSDDVVDASVKFTDTQDTLKRSINALGATVGGQLIPVMQKASEFIIANLPTFKAIAQNVITPVIGTIKFLVEHIKTLSIISGIAIGVITGFKILASVGKLMMLYNDAVIACNGASKVFTVWQALIGKNAEFMAVKFALLATWQKIVTVAQWAWNVAMTANPIGLIIVGVGALIAGIVLLIKNWDKVTEAVGKAIEKLKMFCGIKPKDKKVKVDVEETKTDGKKPPKHATGTPYFAGGYTSINEGGRGEIVNLPSGSQIIPHDIAKTSANKSIKIDVNFNVDGNLIGNKELFEEFSNMLLTKVQNKLQTV